MWIRKQMWIVVIYQCCIVGLFCFNCVVEIVYQCFVYQIFWEIMLCLVIVIGVDVCQNVQSGIVFLWLQIVEVVVGVYVCCLYVYIVVIKYKFFVVFYLIECGFVSGYFQWCVEDVGIWYQCFCYMGV